MQRHTPVLVKWKGYDETTWEAENFLKDESGRNIAPLVFLSISFYCVLHNREEGDGVTVTPSSAFLSLHTYVLAFHCTPMYAPITAHLCTRLSLHTYVRACHCTACARLSLHTYVRAYHCTPMYAPITAQLVRAYQLHTLCNF